MTTKTTNNEPESKSKKVDTRNQTQKLSALINPRYNPITMLQEFLKLEAAGGAILILCAALAMVVANSSFNDLYHHILYETTAVVGVGSLRLEKDVIHWINDGLMVIFFFLIGLELKREMMEGMLSTKEQLILPIITAFGGMATPGLIFYLINQSSDIPQSMNGWAIPTATDIAFALGVLSILGKRVPIALKVFLLAFAIMDDLGAIAIIAMFYTTSIDAHSLVLAGMFLAGLVSLNYFNVSKGTPYLILSIGLWICVLNSGLHATLAGVVAAFTIPLQVKEERRSLLRQLEHDLHSFVAFIILPLFAFANAGVNLDGITMNHIFAPVTLGVILALVIGKPVGITLFTWFATASGLAKLPKGMNMKHVAAVGLVSGIGFTMSIFIATLGYQGKEDFMIDFLREAKLGILIGSIISALGGLYLLWKMFAEKPIIDQKKEADDLNPCKK